MDWHFARIVGPASDPGRYTEERVEIMDVLEIITTYLKTNGYDGLANHEIPCGCCIGDLCPCEEVFLECLPAYKHYDQRPGKVGMWGMFTQKEPPTTQQFERMEEEV